MSQTAERRDPAPMMSSDATSAPTLPQTVTQRRNAKLRASALQTIPLLLFLFAAGLRLWAPDLVPFGARQAEHVAAADSRVPVRLTALYADPSATPLTLVWPLLRELPHSVLLWVMLRGLLDSLGVALLFLAARPLVGVWGAVLAAMLYAVNPWVWAAARDPAGPLTPLLVVAALFGAVRLVARPTPVSGAILGVLLGLLARSVSPGLIVVLLGASALAVAQASWKVGGVTALALVMVSGPALLAPIPPVNGQAFAQGHALALPAWLIEGHLYPYLGAKPAQWVYESGIRLPWASSRPADAHWIWAAWLSPTVLLSLCAACVSLYLIWRGQRLLWLPLVWALSWAVIAHPLIRADWSDPNFVPPALFGLPSAIGLAPPLALLLAAPAGSRQLVIRWIGVAGMLLALVPGGYSLIQDMRLVAGAAHARPAFEEPPLNPVTVADPHVDLEGPLSKTPSLREAVSLARALRGTAARMERLEFVRPFSRAYERLVPNASALDTIFAAHRAMPPGVLPLPLEREAAYLLATGQVAFDPPSLGLERPSSLMRVFTPDGADTGARVVTLRPRSVADWTAGATPVPDGRFNDGSRLVAVARVGVLPGPNGQPYGADLQLYWELPAAADGRAVGDSVLVRYETAAAPGGVASPGRKLPDVAQRRAGELFGLRTRVSRDLRSGAAGSPGIVVQLHDVSGAPIRRPDGSTELFLPIN